MLCNFSAFYLLFNFLIKYFAKILKMYNLGLKSHLNLSKMKKQTFYQLSSTNQVLSEDEAKSTLGGGGVIIGGSGTQNDPYIIKMDYFVYEDLTYNYMSGLASDMNGSSYQNENDQKWYQTQITVTDTRIGCPDGTTPEQQAKFEAENDYKDLGGGIHIGMGQRAYTVGDDDLGLDSSGKKILAQTDGATGDIKIAGGYVHNLFANNESIGTNPADPNGSGWANGSIDEDDFFKMLFGHEMGHDFGLPDSTNGDFMTPATIQYTNGVITAVISGLFDKMIIQQAQTINEVSNPGEYDGEGLYGLITD